MAGQLPGDTVGDCAGEVDAGPPEAAGPEALVPALDAGCDSELEPSDDP